MITYKKEKIETPVKIQCDICKKEYSLKGNDFIDSDINEIIEANEFFSIEEQCGFGSIFDDGVKIQIDMCQHCFKEKLGQYIRIVKNKW